MENYPNILNQIGIFKSLDRTVEEKFQILSQHIDNDKLQLLEVSFLNVNYDETFFDLIEILNILGDSRFIFYVRKYYRRNLFIFEYKIVKSNNRISLKDPFRERLPDVFDCCQIENNSVKTVINNFTTCHLMKDNSLTCITEKFHDILTGFSDVQCVGDFVFAYVKEKYLITNNFHRSYVKYHPGDIKAVFTKDYGIVLTSDGINFMNGGYGPRGKFKDIFSGEDLYVALKEDSTVSIFSGIQEIENRYPDMKFSEVSIGNDYVIGLSPEGEILELTNPKSNKPKGLGFTKIASSKDSSIALRNDGTVKVWGKINMRFRSEEPVLDVKISGKLIFLGFQKGTVISEKRNLRSVKIEENISLELGKYHYLCICNGRQVNPIIRL